MPLCLVPASQLLTNLCIGQTYYRAAPVCVCVILLSMALHSLICQKNQYDWIELYREQSQNNFSNVFFGGHTTGFARINIRKVLSLECLGSVNTFSSGFTVITCKPQILIRTLYTICTSTFTNTRTEGDTGFLLFFSPGTCMLLSCNIKVSGAEGISQQQEARVQLEGAY